VDSVIAAARAEITAAVPARYSDVAIETPLPREVFEALWVTARGLGYEKLFARHADMMDPRLVRLGPLARAYSLSRFFEAIGNRRSFVSAAFKLFESVDLLLMPTMPIVAFDAAVEVPSGGAAAMGHLDPIHVSLQPERPTGNLAAVRTCARRHAGCRADRRTIRQRRARVGFRPRSRDRARFPRAPSAAACCELKPARGPE